VAGCAALAALSAAATFLAARLVPGREWLPGLLGGGFGDDAAGKGMKGRLRHRKLPKGDGEDSAPIPWLPQGQDEDQDETVSPQERTRRAREERIQVHEEQLRLQLQARERRVRIVSD